MNDHEPGATTPQNNENVSFVKSTFSKGLQMLVAPGLFLLSGILLLVLLGFAQKTGWISAGGPQKASAQATEQEYICPMMCVPPTTVPGDCPVCGMELVPASSGSKGGERTIEIDPASRRIANIETVLVEEKSIFRTIRAIGEITYDEGSLKTISAYVGGRLDRLFADFTGVKVNKGDDLALLYSPELYSSQVEFLLAEKNARQNINSSSSRLFQSSTRLQASAKQRLLEFGMTENQIQKISQAGKANSRTLLQSPISGTVIEKLAVEGSYVKEGDVIYRIADLSSVWLMLKLFPEDAAAIRYGQKVTATMQSQPGTQISGRVAFVDPFVDPRSRTVQIRVVIPNPAGLLRIGDYATAKIEIPVKNKNGMLAYDPELANKWISPRHPHIVRDAPGACPICKIELVPASQFGFSGTPLKEEKVLTVPRHAVLMAGNHSLVYVEIEPGKFELRPVVLGPTVENWIVIIAGLHKGESVATRGNFLIDSAMQLAGNPSLIDPEKFVQEPRKEELTPEILASLEALTAADRELVLKQKICPVADTLLGSMGPPIKVDVEGTAVFICCAGCKKRLLENPKKYLEKLKENENKGPSSASEPQGGLDFGLPPEGATMQIIDP